MANDNYLEMLNYLGVSGTLPPRVYLVQPTGSNYYMDAIGISGTVSSPVYEQDTEPGPVTPIKNRPVFATIKPSAKGKKAGVEEREDGLYLGNVKLIDKKILVK
jgi:hypothetical protein